MKLRKLNGNDIFKMSRILKKIEFNPDLSNIKGQDTEAMQISVGMNMFKNILENLHLAQDEVNDFLGGLCGCTGEEFGEKDLDEIGEIILEFKNMIKGSSFFSTVLKLM